MRSMSDEDERGFAIERTGVMREDVTALSRLMAERLAARRAE